MLTIPEQTPSLDRLEKLLAGRSLIVASDRSPFEYAAGEDVGVAPTRARGGLVTALSPLTKLGSVLWIASAKDEIERPVASDRGGLPGKPSSIRLVAAPLQTYHQFYNVACNALWFLQHQMWDQALAGDQVVRLRRAWSDGYVPVNRLIADEVVREARRSATPLIMVQDIHLYLVPRLVREQLPNAVIEHFVHVPWAPPSVWDRLHHGIRRDILEGLLSASIVGLQTQRDVQGFLDCCRAFLRDVRVDGGASTVVYDDREILVRAYPASVDLDELRQVAAASETREHERALLPLRDDKTVVRVDRVDPIKGIPQGFRAFSRLLDRRPDLVGRVRFLAFLVPSPEDIPGYRRCQEDIDREVGTVNDRFQRDGWQPVTVFYGHDYHRAIAALRLYDVLLVNPLIEGMNLVAKEGPMVNTRNGVLVLSKAAGAHEQLGGGAVSIDPGDLDGTSDALEQALAMPGRERASRTAVLRSAIESEDAVEWVASQLRDLDALP